MSSQILLSGGDKYYSYSGIIFGDVSVPATIPMITIDNTGLRDSSLVIQPFYSLPVSTSSTAILGIEVKIDNVTVINSQTIRREGDDFVLFAPRNSKLEIISLNTSSNNTQTRGCNVLGYYL